MIDKSEEAIRRAQKAKALLDDPLVQEAFAEVERKLVEGWRRSAAADSEGRERIHRVLCGLDAFKAFFAVALENGQVAAYQVEQLKRGQFPA